jgi:hypothetical protein
MGLVPNRAGYRLYRTHHVNKSVIESGIKASNTSAQSDGEDNLYKIHSSLPSFWVGQYSVFTNSKIHEAKGQILQQDINNFQN